MALKTDIRGMVWEYPDHFEVGREHIRDYAKAIKVTDAASYDEKRAAELGYHAIVAPLTFTSIFALLIQQHFFRHVDVGIETMQIVQVDQKFVYHKPIQAGDKLYGTMYIHSVDERFGADIVVTRNVCTNDKGELVLEAFTTMMGQQGTNSAEIKWDRQSGQVMRVAVGE
jgi:acyl-CoA thioesterase FadM